MAAKKSNLSSKAKKAYYDRVRRSNYLASLRLERFDVEREAVMGELSDRTSSDKKPDPRAGDKIPE